ncbi:hypothetical protein CS022_03270 [Veronia nyctiphanis]|uniref:GGDEF domain-containing protein n=2 Tax=Veronia nyctiphanis TaxID=1278244 RepID=A0A4Q0YTJ7_9GAMM|nr:hypothetical protein CS022_03270 [Veronia nyctiphanis]
MLFTSFVCMLILCVTFMLYRYVEDSEREHQLSMMDGKLTEIVNRLDQYKETDNKQIMWLSRQLSRYPKIDQRLWISFSNDLIRLFPHFQHVQWFDNNQMLRWETHNDENKTAGSILTDDLDIRWDKEISYSIKDSGNDIRIVISSLGKRSKERIGTLVIQYSLKRRLDEIQKSVLSQTQLLSISSQLPADYRETIATRLSVSRPILLGEEVYALYMEQHVSPYPKLLSLPMAVFITGLVAATLCSITLYLLEINYVGRRAVSRSIRSLRRELKAQKETENRLQFVAYHDQKTLLPNRHSLEMYLEKAILVEQDIVLTCIDISNLNEINDMYGHHIGEHLLFDIVKRFRTILPRHAMMARVDSSQFMISVAGMCQLEAEMQANQLRICLEEEFNIENNQIIAHCLIGIAYRLNRSINTEELIRHAETATHRARNWEQAILLLTTRQCRNN